MFSSCKKWLSVQPEDQFTQDQIFTSTTGTQQALNAIYLQMGDNKLYGAYMTMVFPEILAQQYNIIASSHTLGPITTYTYVDEKSVIFTEAIWTKAFAAIAGVNNFLNGITVNHVLTAEQDSVLRGEAYGLRAYLHLDMLRLFGPVYASADSTALSIPYYRNISTNFNPYLPANKVMDSIEADLAEAARLLKNDPVIVWGKGGNPAANSDPFFQNRNYRMNYYAVKALQARTYMYRGNKTGAYDAANEVITNAQAKFPWITTTALTNDKDNPDRIFSSELLFALQSVNMYSNYNTYYAPSLTDANILAPTDARLKTTFEDNSNDFRYTYLWFYPSVGSKSYRTFYKYADVVKDTMRFRYMMPMIRISEMYYIAAECATDATTAINYLNTVRYNRNLVNLANTVTLRTELTKEYQKEFIGEGQLFFYYKRINRSTIPNGTSTASITMTNAKYTAVKPSSETNFH
ncbi:outer membrane protein, nutrient binding [Filimonas lacunae]|nr:outer membrane protein, nutrient binding [Filimonas lacunae]